MYAKLPDATEIAAFGDAQLAIWAPQAKDDTEALALYQRMDVQDTWGHASRDVALKGLRVGFSGVMVDRSAAGIASSFFLKVIPWDDRPKTRETVDRKLEPFFAGALRRAARTEIMIPAKRDMLIYGRGVTEFLPNPRLWADDSEYRHMVQELLHLTDENVKQAADGRDKKLIEEIEKIEANIVTFKERNFPLRWKRLDPRVTWPQIVEDDFTESIEIGYMTRRQIETEFGTDCLPQGAGSLSGESRLRVYRYVNHNWISTVIPHHDTSGKLNDAAMVRSWEHGLGMLPHVYFEGNILPEDSSSPHHSGVVSTSSHQRRRWKGVLYDFKDVLETINEILTDIRNIHRRDSQTPLQANFDPNLRSQDPTIAGNAGNIVLEPDERNIMHFWLGEGLSGGPVTGINPQSLRLLEWLTEFAYQIVLNPALLGHIKSGVSGAGFDAALFAAKENMLPFENAVERGLLQIGQLIARSVPRLHEMFPSHAEPIVVVDEKLGKISVLPKDVEGVEAYIQPKIRSASPLSKQQQANLMIALSNLPLSPIDYMEMGGDIEDAGGKVERFERWKLRQVLQSMLEQLVMQHAGLLADTLGGESQAGLSDRIAGLPPAIQQGLASRGSSAAQEAQGRSRQSAGAAGQALEPKLPEMRDSGF